MNCTDKMLIDNLVDLYADSLKEIILDWCKDIESKRGIDALKEKGTLDDIFTQSIDYALENIPPEEFNFLIKQWEK